MQSFQGIYDGKKLKIFENIKIDSPKKVIITFLEAPTEDITSEELHNIANEGGAFDYLYNKEEDIYTDSDLKVKY